MSDYRENNPQAKLNFHEEHTALKEKLHASLNQCILNSEKPFDVVKDAQQAAISPLTKAALADIETRLWFRHFVKCALWAATGTLLGAGIVTAYALAHK